MVRVVTLVAVLFAMCTSVSLADPKHDGETVVGAIWHWVITNGDKEMNGDFRVKDGAIYVGDDKIGSTKGSLESGEVTMTFGGYEALNGRANLTKVMTKPAAFRGTLHKKDGSEWQMRVVVRNR